MGIAAEELLAELEQALQAGKTAQARVAELEQALSTIGQEATAALHTQESANGDARSPLADCLTEIKDVVEATLHPSAPTDDQETAWDVLRRYAGSVDAPPDWSLEHDHYLYGTPKRYSDPESAG